MPKRPGPSSRLTRSDILRAAYRHFELDETQASIAADLGISTGYLARRLKQARADGWVRFYTDIPAEEQRAAALKQRFPQLSEVQVVGGLSPVRDSSVAAISQVLAGWLNDMLAVEPGEQGHVGAVATGGGSVHMHMLDRILPREAPCDVGPTSLAPLSGRVPRWPASTIAAVMCFRLDARSGTEQSGTLVDLSVEAREGDLDDLAAWWRRTRQREGFEQMQAFWRAADVVFIGATTLDKRYPERRARLASMGLDGAALRKRGAVGVAAGQFFDVSGQRVDLADGVPSLTPSIPLELLAEKCAERRAGNASRAVILDVRGPQARAARHLIDSGLLTHLASDIEAADLLLAR